MTIIAILTLGIIIYTYYRIIDHILKSRVIDNKLSYLIELMEEQSFFNSEEYNEFLKWKETQERN